MVKMYEIDITLDGFSPKVWRRLQVLGHLSLGDVHWGLAESMGWKGFDRHTFELDGGVLPGFNMGLSEAENEYALLLQDVFTHPKTVLNYLYHDPKKWRHSITLLRTFEASEGMPSLRCVDGAGTREGLIFSVEEAEAGDACQEYSPDDAPQNSFLMLDLSERLDVIESFHNRYEPHPRPQSMSRHALMHLEVEVFLLEDDVRVVKTLGALLAKGLSRHGAIHAIGSVMFAESFDSCECGFEDFGRYEKELTLLRGHAWPGGGRAELRVVKGYFSSGV